MRITRFMRDMGGRVITVVVAAMGIFMASHHFMAEGFEQSFRKQILSMRSVVDDILENTKLRLFQEAYLLSDTRELENAFYALDPAKLTRFAMNAMERCRANFATIVDAKGNVMARGHSNKRGDNIAESPLIKRALAGKSVIDIVKLTNNGLSVAAAAPIMMNGSIVGAVMFGESLCKNGFVDEVKRVTGLEMTVFENDVRISTTIIRDGKRAIGTLLDNPEVADMVLQRGGTFCADTDILGRAYKTVYWPIQNAAGTIFGMWFIGTEVEGVQRTLTTIALSCLLATLVIAAALSVLGVTFFRSLVAPLQKKAYVDKLTGITNRAGFEREIERIFETGGRPAGLFLIDLDNFKQLNDTLGHPVGDECLKYTGQILREVFRETDVVARLGGDEFVVYAPTLDSAEVITTKLNHLLQRLNKEFSEPSGKTVTVSASIGASVSHDGHTDYKDMYKIADEALYHSKEGGRNQFTILCCLDAKNASPAK